MNNQRGFIQIPLLFLIVFGALIATGGSYYAIKHTPQPIQQNVVIEKESKTATTSVETATSTTSQSPTNNPFLDALNDNGATEAPAGYIPIRSATVKPIPMPATSAPVPQELATQKADEGKDRFQEFETRGKQLLTLFEQDEKNFKLLAETIAQHKKRSAEHATQMMDAWITLTDKTIASVSSQYSGMLNSTKNYLVSDRDWVVDYSNSLYDIISGGGYLLNQREADALQFVKSELEKCLTMGAKEWVALNGQSCTISFFELKPDYSKRLIDGANKLGEFDHIVLEAISSHARSAENNVKGDVDLIARYEQLNASIQTSFNSINSQLQQSQAQLKMMNTPIKCYTTTNDSIFNQNRTYSTTCQSDTRTPQQICDEKIAAWLGSGAYTSKPSCE